MRSLDALIVLLLSGVFLLTLAPLVASVHVAEYDEAVFLDVARNIQRLGLPLRSIGASGVYYFLHTPLYVYLLSLYARHTDAGLFLARSVTVIAGLAAVGLTYASGSRVGGRRAGAVAALLLALNPFFEVYAFFVCMEMFMLLALLVGFYTLIIAIEGEKHRAHLISGIVFAVAVLFKELALVGAAVAAAYAFWQWRRPFKRGAAAALAVGMPSLLALAAWLVWASNLSPLTIAATMKRWLDSVVSSAGADPRMSLTLPAWAAQVGSQLLGPGMVLGLLFAAGLWMFGRGRVERGLGVLLAYTFVAVGLSFFTSLKETRHLIGILPAAAILGGWALVRIWDRRKAGRGKTFLASATASPVVAAAAIIVVLIFAGPLRPPLLPRPAGFPSSWIAPVYAERLANDDFYSVLALAGQQVATTTAPADVVTVVHQATVVSYYAGRSYVMLYTLPEPRVIDLLGRATVLVWDAPTFLALDKAAIDRVQALLAADFALETVVSDDHRSVAIYRRKVKP